MTRLLAPILATAVVMLLSATAAAQVRMIRLDEITQEVTIKNFGSGDVDVSAYQMCRSPGNYQALSVLTLLEGDLDLSPGEEVSFIYGAILSTGTGIGLYSDTGFGDPNDMADYMQYKGVPGFREDVAVLAGLWTAGEFAAGDSGPYLYTGDGIDDYGAAFWVPEPGSTLLGSAALAVIAWRKRTAPSAGRGADGRRC